MFLLLRFPNVLSESVVLMYYVVRTVELMRLFLLLSLSVVFSWTEFIDCSHRSHRFGGEESF